MNRPNLFNFATRELGQDAVLCWLANWADPVCANDQLMHSLGNAFLRTCFELAEKAFPRIEKVQVKAHEMNLPVLILVNQQYAILIEDNAYSSQQDGQLNSRQELFRAGYAGYEPIFIHLQTGDQSDNSEAVRQGYRIIGRETLLELLGSSLRAGCDSEILRSFHYYLQRMQEANQAYLHQPLPWTTAAWQGFFAALQVELKTGRWDYVSNPSGGFMGFWWHQIPVPRGKLYLQLEDDRLCVKLVVNKRDSAEQLRDSWQAKLITVADRTGTRLEPPINSAPGLWMTIGVSRKYLVFDGSQLDMSATVALLRTYERLLDAVAKTTD